MRTQITPKRILQLLLILIGILAILTLSACTDFSAMQQEIEWEATGYDEGNITVELD